MIEEVNKIIYNMLISGRGVFLPDVGTLFIERRGARKISADRLLSPRNAVSFSSREQAPSLVTEIATIAGSTLKIGGVGVLNDKSFSAEAGFNTAINPDGVKTLVIRRRSNAWLYAVCAVCVLVAVGVGVYMQWGTSLLSGMSVVKSNAPTDRIADAALPSADNDIADATMQGDSLINDAGADTGAQNAQSAQNAESVAPQTAPPAVEAEAEPTPAPVTSVSEGKYAYYVVMGVFSTEQNANRALEQVKRHIEDLNGAILPFKGKFITAIFGSDKRDDCASFARSYRDIYPDLWIYNVK